MKPLAGGAALLALLAAAPAAGAVEARVVYDPYLPPPEAAELAPVPRGAVGPPRQAPDVRAAAARPIRAALDAAVGTGAIADAERAAYVAVLRDARAAHRRLSGTRRALLGDVLGTLGRIAAAGRLTPSRLPALFLTLERNTDFMLNHALPPAGRRIKFGDSPILFQMYPGRGLQLQPLGNFGRVNAYATLCEQSVRAGGQRGCASLRRQLDWLLAIAVRRGAATTWEYYFPFRGGAPPFVSASSQGSALSAFSRGWAVLREPAYKRAATSALGVFAQRAPLGVRKPAARGNHYLAYSFAPRLEILNQFLIGLVGLHDYTKHVGGTRGRRLFAAGDRVARRQTPLYDTGSWSRYSRGGARSTVGYHRLVTEFLGKLCARTGARVYCRTASRFRGYLPPRRSAPTDRTGGGGGGGGGGGRGSTLVEVPDSGSTTIRLEIRRGARRLLFDRAR